MSENLFNNPVVISAFKEVVKSAYKNSTCIVKEIAITFDLECNCADSSCHDCKNKVLKQLMKLEAKAQDTETQESVEPIKQRLSEDEYEYLKHKFDCGYDYLARDIDGKLYIYKDKPRKDRCEWLGLSHRVFGGYETVKWEDEEPTSIEVLLAEYENEKG